jgi:Cu(I)/Ag(I) efflux system membrane fusion protein
VVVSLPSTEGTYRKQGDPLYTIADLSRVWLILEAYEGDLGLLRLGQRVRFETAAHPGSPFEGRISVVDATLDPRTRTVRVRVEVPNPEGRLKPGMFARASVRVTLGAGGEVVGPSRVGWWLCPVHPSEVFEESGACPRCESELVPAETLAAAAPGGEGVRPPIVVPATAVLRTGRRSVVYVETPAGSEVRYEGREVVLGPQAGIWTIVEAGLAEGERVVTRGNFKIDSALQIQARRSMMSAPGERDPRLAPFRRALAPVYRSGFDLVGALADDRLDRAWKASDRLREALAGIWEDRVRARRRARWKELSGRLDGAAGAVYDADSLEAARLAFEAVAGAMIEIEVEFGHEGDRSHRRVSCPMAFGGRGGEWLDEVEEIRNPYFGASMLRCGTVVETYPGTGSTSR